MNLKKYCQAVLIGLLPWTTAFGVNASYDFSGDFNSTFTVGNSSADSSWDQYGGVGNYTNTVTTPNTSAMIWNTHTLPSDSNWSVSLDITIPLTYDTMMETDGDSGEEFVRSLLAVQFENSQGDMFRATSGLQVLAPFGDGSQRQYIGEFIYNDIPQFTQTGVTGNNTVSALLSYDSSTQIITAFGDATQLYTLDVGAGGDPGWGMTSGDSFLVGILGGSNLEPVLSGYEITVDNLDATGAMAIPEPGTYTAFLGLLALGLVIRHRWSARS